MDDKLTLAKFEEASERVKKVTLDTKLIYSDYFSEATGNKVYIKPENNEWDIRIELPGGFAFADDGIISKIKAVKGVTAVKEI